MASGIPRKLFLDAKDAGKFRWPMKGPSNGNRRFLVVGCGSIGKRHIRNLLTLGVGVVEAFDTREDRRRDVEKEFGIRSRCRLEDAWADAPNAVLITTPTSSHVPLAQQATESGCHLFIEKPLSNELDGTEALQRAIEARGLIALVGCNMRFHPALLKVKQLLDERLVGRVVSVRVQAGQYLPDWHPWEDYRHTYSARRALGGGVILDAIHEIDYVRWMLGEVDAVACFAGRLSHLEVETEDVAGILLRFVDGTIGEVHLDYVQRVYARTGEFIGDEGTIRWDYSTGEVQCYSVKNGDWSVYRNPDGWSPNQMYLDEMRHFIACLDGREQPLLNATEATRVLAIALAAKAAAEDGRVVKLKK